MDHWILKKIKSSTKVEKNINELLYLESYIIWSGNIDFQNDDKKGGSPGNVAQLFYPQGRLPCKEALPEDASVLSCETRKCT